MPAVAVPATVLVEALDVTGMAGGIVSTLKVTLDDAEPVTLVSVLFFA